MLFFSLYCFCFVFFFFFFQAEDGIRDTSVTGVQTCALPIWFRFPICSSATIHSHTTRDHANSSFSHLEVMVTIGYTLFQVANPSIQSNNRSEERRVGKECRSRWWTEH